LRVPDVANVMTRPVSPFAVGGLELDSPVVLAPMAGYTDMAFRLAVRRLGGLGLAVSEMLNPRSFLIGKSGKAAQIVATCPEDSPLACQLYGHEPDIMADGARWLEGNGAAVIDINMGCPQKKISRRGAGAGLLRTPDLAERIVRRVVSSVTIPVTVKVRLVPQDDGDLTARFVRGIADAGAAAVTVHARTRKESFSGSADWSLIARVVEAVPDIPIIGNGDVMSVASALAMVRQTGCRGIMVGRHALKNPWAIRETSAALRGESPPPRPDWSGHIAFMAAHLELMCGLYGEKLAAVLFRRWIPQYAKGLPLDRREMIRLIGIREIDDLRSQILALRPSRSVPA
jgi:tRNA-dihydrouridine synthase B